ncbi:MAG TPA: nuclear transport factor 2 family protein [Roseiflexaceae bacterium]|nr:nuclear transport factor 2 family protein [Roseiflexaceae bacterium]
MSTQNVELVRGLYDAMLRGDMAAVFAQFAPNSRIIEPETLPYGGEYHGVAGLQQLFEKVFAVWEEFGITAEKMLAEGDTVVALVTLRGTLRGVEQPIAMQIAEYWELRDGKVTLCRPFYGDSGLITKLLAERQGAPA